MRLLYTKEFMGFPHSSVGKESACNAGDLCLIPGLGRTSREGNGNSFQYSCLENPWWAIVHEVTRIRQDLATKPPRHLPMYLSIYHRNDFASWKESYDKTRRCIKKQRTSLC